jgi:hypothetical protein
MITLALILAMVLVPFFSALILFKIREQRSEVELLLPIRRTRVTTTPRRWSGRN